MERQLREATRLWTLAVPKVSAFITSIVRDFQDRDDILQETAVAVLESFARYDSSRSFVAWSIGIARNQIRLHFRKKFRERLAFDTEAVDALAVAFAAGGAKDPRLDDLSDCFEELDNRSKELCRLRYEEELKPASIAHRLGVGANAVAKSLQRIRERLQQCVSRKVAGAIP